ncbi:MAG: type II toxin-antitoxin system prevent-host-death family antitoxin [Nitrospira sp.]|nr:type II toxin-antitoxin system prevent-host-death family antitoxin [Nitrospira sp.]MCP9456149.1 type II toxin-antitoxin system prevent-host-death family antitoxin [Nitrospira sp.]
MAQVGVRKLRDHLSGYLKKVKEGEEVEVTDRGRVIARFVPAESRRVPAGVDALVREGLATWSGGKPQGAKRPLVLRGRSVSDLVIAERR